MENPQISDAILKVLQEYDENNKKRQSIMLWWIMALSMASGTQEQRDFLTKNVQAMTTGNFNPGEIESENLNLIQKYFTDKQMHVISLRPKPAVGAGSKCTKCSNQRSKKAKVKSSKGQSKNKSSKSQSKRVQPPKKPKSVKGKLS